MSEVTKPLMLDETGQDIAEAIRGIGLGNYVVVNVNNYAWGSVMGAGLIPYGAEITITATPKTNCYFIAFTDANGNVLTANTTYTFTPTGNTVINAIFSSRGTVKIVPWATGTDQEIVDMVNAHYEGVIDLHDFWKVGDTRLSMVNAMGTGDIVMETHAEQQVEWVLQDTALIGITPADDDITALAFAVGMKDCLLEKGKQGLGKNWNQNIRKTWCNDIFYNSIPATFRGIFKEFTAKVTNFDGVPVVTVPEMIDTTGKIMFYPQSTILGDSAEFLEENAAIPQFEYNRIPEHHSKKLGLNGSATVYSTSTSYNRAYNNYWRTINNAGQNSYSEANTNDGLSMFGCI